MKCNTPFLKKATGVWLILFSCLASATAQWPQFRGPEQNMVVPKSDLPATWSETQHVKWIYPMEGTGWSSPVVWDNKVFITSAVTIKKVKAQTPPPPPPAPAQGIATAAPAAPREEVEDTSYRQDVYRWEVVCVDLNTGKEIWKQVAIEGSPRVKTHDGNGYAAETPVTDGKRVYAYFGMTGLFCYDMDGKLLWKKDLGAFRTQKGWGTGSSPVVFNDILYVQVDNEINSFLVALDVQTGKEKWKALRDEKTNYSTPVIWKNSIRTELVVSGKTARSYDLNTGNVLWEMKIPGEYNVPSPVVDKDMLYIGNAGGRETKGSLFAVKAGAAGDISLTGEVRSKHIVWSIAEAPVGNPSPLQHNGYLYVLSSRGGELNCYDASNGNAVYTKKIENVTACWSTPWIYNNIFHFYDERGIVKQVKTGPQFELIPAQSKLDDKFWASVAVANNSYLFKGAKKLYCISK